MAKEPDWKEGLREEAIEDEPLSLAEVLGDETASGEGFSWEKVVEEMKRSSLIKGDRDDLAYMEREAASLGNLVAQLKEIAERQDPSMTEFQMVALEDAVANMQSEVLELLDVEIEDAGRKGDLIYTAIGLIQAAYDIGKNAKPTIEAAAVQAPNAVDVEAAKTTNVPPTASDDISSGIATEAALTTFIQGQDHIRPRNRKTRRLGIQAPVREALRLLYSQDPLFTGSSRNSVRRAVADKLNVPIGAVSLATLDRARLVVWPTTEESDETGDI